MITALKHVGTIDNPEDISEFVGTGCLIWVDVEGITAEDADRLIDEFETFTHMPTCSGQRLPRIA